MFGLFYGRNIDFQTRLAFGAKITLESDVCLVLLSVSLILHFSFPCKQRQFPGEVFSAQSIKPHHILRNPANGKLCGAMFKQGKAIVESFARKRV